MSRASVSLPRPRAARSGLGRASWLRDVAGVPEVPEVDAGTVVWVAHDARLLGRLELYDPPRGEARAAIDEVRALGVSRVVLITGDLRSITGEVATERELDDWEAEIHPDHKLARVHAEQAAGRVVMMVGDGINDALALAGADVGVAVGSEAGSASTRSRSAAPTSRSCAPISARFHSSSDSRIASARS